MNALREKYDAYMARWHADGRHTVQVTCPHCRTVLDMPAPESRDETWDSLTVCPECEEMFMEVVTHARGEARIPSGVLE